MKDRPQVTAFILGFLISILLGLAFFAGQQQGTQQVDQLETRQVLLTSKVHLIEMKVDVINDQKSPQELQKDFDKIMGVLEQSHQYTGDGIIARDQAMQAAAAEINAAIMAGGERLVQAIESMLAIIEEHLYRHKTTQDNQAEILETRATST